MIDTEQTLIQLKQAESMKLLKEVRVMEWEHPTNCKQIWYIKFQPDITANQKIRLEQHLQRKGIITMQINDGILRAYIPK